MKVVDDTKAVLQDVREKVKVMDRKNKQAARKFIVEIRNSLKERTKIGADKVKRVIEDGIGAIKFELQNMTRTTGDVSRRIVDIAKLQVDTIVGAVSAADEQHLTQSLEEAIAGAEGEIQSMWYGLDQVYGHYSDDWSKAIEAKVTNMTERIGGLVNSQRRTCECTTYDHVNMCYNVSMANIDTSKTVETVVRAMAELYDAAGTTDTMLATYAAQDADQHSLTIVDESKSLLDTYKRIGRDTLDEMLGNELLFLGSAIQKAARDAYPHVKRFILRTWKTSVEQAPAAYDAATAGYSMVTDDDRIRIFDQVEDSLQKLRSAIETRAQLVGDETARSRFLEGAKFERLKELGNRFENVTRTHNAIFAGKLTSAGEALKFDVDWTVKQKIPYLSSLTIANFLPTEVCPLAMDFAGYLNRFLQDTVFKDRVDTLDVLLPTNGLPYVSEGTQTDEERPPSVVEWPPKISHDGSTTFDGGEPAEGGVADQAAGEPSIEKKESDRSGQDSAKESKRLETESPAKTAGQGELERFEKDEKTGFDEGRVNKVVPSPITDHSGGALLQDSTERKTFKDAAVQTGEEDNVDKAEHLEMKIEPTPVRSEKKSELADEHEADEKKDLHENLAESFSPEKSATPTTSTGVDKESESAVNDSDKHPLRTIFKEAVEKVKKMIKVVKNMGAKFWAKLTN